MQPQKRLALKSFGTKGIAPRVRTTGFVLFVMGLCASGLSQSSSACADDVLANRVNAGTGQDQFASVPARPSIASQSVFVLDYTRHHRRADCQVPLPPVGAISPFPLALRLGALVSPRTLVDVGIDATIPGLHLLPSMSSRVDADAIISANFGGVSTTVIPVTFDQIANLNLPISSRVYLGAGVGPYFSTQTRIGGKLIAGAEFAKKLGVEGNVHFAGIGPTLFTIQARLAL